MFERNYEKGFYVTEYDVIRAMKECGFRSKISDGQTYFNVSKKSKAIQKYFASLGTPSKADPLE